MKFKDLLERIDDITNSDQEIARIIYKIIKNREKLHISSLDMSVFLVYTQCTKLMTDEDIRVFADSQYVKYVVPELFATDLRAVNDKQFIDEVVDYIKEHVEKISVPNEHNDIFLEHEFSNEINIDSLNINVINEALANNVQLQVNTTGCYSFPFSFPFLLF